MSAYRPRHLMAVCVAYFTGQYPAPLDDYAFALDKEVASLKVNVAEVSA